MPKKKLTIADLRGKKLTVDKRGEKLEGKLAPLTPSELRKIRDDISTRMTALEQEWENSRQTDVHALLAALIFCELQLPYWVFKGLFEFLSTKLPKEPGLHWGRWLLVKDARNRGLSWQKAYKDAAERATDTKYAGKWRTMKESYEICQRELRDQQSRDQQSGQQ